MQIYNTNNTIFFHGKYALNNYKGCLKAGAIGDALGKPIEFDTLDYIKRKYGINGLQDLILNHKNIAEITDDTQMTMFTADGLIKSALKKFDIKKLPDMKEIYNSYQLWFKTQFDNTIQKSKGWISELSDLYDRRAPGMTCLSSLERNIAGSIKYPPNDSAGCGGVMRVAPVGLMYKDNPEMAFKIGAECAALTHGNPRGYLPAGLLSEMIAYIISGNDINSAVQKSLTTLQKYNGNEKVLELMQKAQHLAKTNTKPEKAIEQLGEGWDGDEAIAIATYCALKEPNNFEKAVKMAINHSGDSDSTGSILGNIVGSHLGIEKIPQKWINKIELTKELDILAEDLYIGPQAIKDAEKRYPISNKNKN